MADQVHAGAATAGADQLLSVSQVTREPDGGMTIACVVLARAELEALPTSFVRSA